MQLRSDSFADGQPIPPTFAFAKPGNPIAHAENRTPHLAWRDAPAGTRSFVLTVIDPDVPSRGDDVNKADRSVPADLRRVKFVHWLMADIPPECTELAAGACGEGVVPHGKQQPAGPPGCVQGINDFTGFFAGDTDMVGEYFGYDGPCPPWNDELVHHYQFRIWALDVATLDLARGYTLSQLHESMDGHVLATADWTGTYTLNSSLQG